MRWIFIFALVSGQSSVAAAQSGQGGSRAEALGGTYVALADDAWSIFHNAGGLAWLVSKELSIAHRPQVFGLGELSSTTIALSFPTPIGSLGVGGRKFGFDLYRESEFRVSYASRIAGVGTGISLSYYAITIERYGSAAAIGLDVGLSARLHPDIHWGLAIGNINAPKIGTTREKRPQSFATGVSYSPVTSVRIVLDYFKETRFNPSVRFGLEYQLVDALILRTGYSDNPALLSAGLGLRYELIKFDYSFSTHEALGGTHQISVTLQWGVRDE